MRVSGIDVPVFYFRTARENYVMLMINVIMFDLIVCNARDAWLSTEQHNSAMHI